MFVGIDPGKTGAAAIIDDESKVLSICEWSKNTVPDIWDWIEKHSLKIHVALIEKVSSSPQMGVRSAFSFGENYGTWTGMLTAASLRFDFVSPQKWQNSLSCKTGGDKNITKAKAQQLFGNQNLKITHATADCLLIAEYAKRNLK